ncbi:MAG: cytidylate kinase-like family protein [Deltaproteobacteria bacterium]|nr:cytidylate kinase-like family protein [Deltaproteobacteria bacterium]
MAIITISRGSYSKGKEIAEKVAQELGYECIARKVLLEAKEEFNVPELKLVRAIHDAPSILDRLSYRREKYITFIQAEILKHFKQDNIVYHGLAGHFFVKGISHVLKVRIIADLEYRVKLEMARKAISGKEAMSILLKDDEERRKWSEYLYGIDTSDSSNYDLMIHIHKLTVEDAVDFICHTARLQKFQATAESQKAIDDLALAAQAKAALTDLNADLRVSARDGILLVNTEAPSIHSGALARKIKEIAQTVPGVREVKIDVIPSWPEAIG